MKFIKEKILEHKSHKKNLFLNNKLFKSLFLSSIIMLMILSVSSVVFGDSPSTVTVIPTITAHGVDDQPFEATVTAGAGHNVHEFRVYESGDFDDLNCDSKTGWYAPIYGTNVFGRFCLWAAYDGNEISPGDSEEFTFTMDSPDTECCRVMRTEPRDLEQSWQPILIDICVDKTDPETTKEYGIPTKVVGDYRWITSSIPITLTATDCPGGCDRDNGPHDAGIYKIYWRNTLLEIADNDCIEKCSYGGSGSWNEHEGDTITFYKKEDSCHLIEFYAEDNLEHTETIKKQCVFVDNTPPISDKKHGIPLIEDDGFDWVNQSTEITLDCIDQGDHPVDQETLCYKVSLDDDELIYLTEDYCTEFEGTKFEGTMKDGWCCVYVGDDKGENKLTIHFLEDSYHNLEYFCIDHLGNDERDLPNGAPHIQWYKVDTVPPSITKTMLGNYVDDDTCPPEPGEYCYVADDGSSGVRVSVKDGGDICAVDQAVCEWGYWWEGKYYGPYRETSFPFDILFDKDSTHDLDIRCWDALGNEVVDEERFLVDSTPPETTKEYGYPFVEDWYPKGCYEEWAGHCKDDPDCIAGYCYWAEWINSSTRIELSAEDNKVGVDKTYWRNIVLDQSDWHYCYADCKAHVPIPPPEPMNPGGTWKEYIEPFTKPEESCHIIEYYSFDLLGNVEEIDWQCVFVDNTPPAVDKNVGDPQVYKNDQYYISGQTPITMYCWDIEPHPVDHVSLWYRYRVSDDCQNWGKWTEWIDPNGHVVEKTIYFPEDSCHELEYYCEDGLGNAGPIHKEIDIVDSQPPVIEKEVVGPQVECPPQEPREPEPCEGWDCVEAEGLEKDFFTTGRHGGSGWKNGIIDVSIDPFAAQVSNNVVWPEGVAKDFSVSYDPSTGDVTYTQGTGGEQTVLTYNYGTNMAFEYIIPVAKGNKDGASTELTELVINGKPLSDINSGSGIKGIWVPLTDAEQVNGFKITGKAKLIRGSKPQDERPAFHVFAMNTHPLDCLIIDGVTNITVNAYDPMPHPVEEVKCQWWYTVNGEGPYYVDSQGDRQSGESPLELTTSFDINFPEESDHLLHIYCEDGLYNAIEDVERFIVDKTPPETTKWYEGPKYSVGGLSEYSFADTVDIDGSTAPLEVTVTDDGEWVTWTFDFPVEDFTGDGNLNVGLIIATDGEGQGPAFQIHNNDGADSNYDWGTWLMSPWGPTITDGWNGWHSGDTNTPVTSLSWVEATGNRNVPHGDGILQVKILKSELGGSFHWAASPTVGSGFYAPVYDVTMQIPTTFSWSTPIVDMTVPNYVYAEYVEGYPLWITSETEVWLSAHDEDGPHVSGVDKTYYRDVYLDDPEDWRYCYENCDEWSKDERYGEGVRYGLPTAPEPYNPRRIYGWTLWEGEPFHKENESCHIIEYYSFDYVKKLEEVKWQCVFVDNTAPEPNKTVEEPREKWDGEDSVFYEEETQYCWNDCHVGCYGEGKSIDCWKVTLDTPISMNCTDPEPHPVDNEKVCFNVEVDGEDKTDYYCEEYGGIMNEKDYCCVPHVIDDFKFLEETEHNLKYYCIDALGNSNEEDVDEEKFKVMGKMFEIQINKKWNLISFPFDPIDKDVKEVFEDVESVEAVWTYDAGANHWFVYRPGGDGTNDLEKVKTGLGYWVLANCEEPGEDGECDYLIVGGSLYSPGPVTPPSINLKEGWNLIGYYGTDGCEIDGYYGPEGEGKEAYCALYSLRNLEGGLLKPTKWSGLLTYWEPDNPELWKELGWCDEMDPGAGYWIGMEADGTYKPQTVCDNSILNALCYIEGIFD